MEPSSQTSSSAASPPSRSGSGSSTPLNNNLTTGTDVTRHAAGKRGRSSSSKTSSQSQNHKKARHAIKLIQQRLKPVLVRLQEMEGSLLDGENDTNKQSTDSLKTGTSTTSTNRTSRVDDNINQSMNRSIDVCEMQATVALSVGMMRYMSARLRGLDQGRQQQQQQQQQTQQRYHHDKNDHGSNSDDPLRKELNNMKRVLADIKKHRKTIVPQKSKTSTTPIPNTETNPSE